MTALSAPRKRLPELVCAYLDRALPPGGKLPSRVCVGQVGEMWQKPGGRPMRFTAMEEFAVENVAFSWRARFPMLGGLVWLRVVDRFTADTGGLVVSLFGLVRVMHQRGPDVDEGEAIRYLAELPLVPQAMIANRALDWREIDSSAVEVSTLVGSRRPAVRLDFDDAGDIIRASTQARPRLEGKIAVPTPWGGVFSDYQTLEGVRLPTRAAVSWELPEGPFTYWRGTVTSVATDRR